MDGLYGIISVSADPVSFKYCWTKKTVRMEYLHWCFLGIFDGTQYWVSGVLI